MMGTVVIELVHLAEDLGLVRDLGPWELDRHNARTLYGRDSAGPVVASWPDKVLTMQVAYSLGVLESMIGEARRRGMLG